MTVSNTDQQKRLLREIIREWLEGQAKGVVNESSLSRLQEFMRSEWRGDFSYADVGEVLFEEVMNTVDK